MVTATLSSDAAGCDACRTVRRSCGARCYGRPGGHARVECIASHCHGWHSQDLRPITAVIITGKNVIVGFHEEAARKTMSEFSGEQNILPKTIWMMKDIVGFHEAAVQTAMSGFSGEHNILPETIGMMKDIVGFHEAAAQTTMSEISGEHNILPKTIGMMKGIVGLPRLQEAHRSRQRVACFTLSMLPAPSCRRAACTIAGRRMRLRRRTQLRLDRHLPPQPRREHWSAQGGLGLRSCVHCC